MFDSWNQLKAAEINLIQGITKNKRYYGVHMIDTHTEYTDVPELITLLLGMQLLTLWSKNKWSISCSRDI